MRIVGGGLVRVSCPKPQSVGPKFRVEGVTCIHWNHGPRSRVFTRPLSWLEDPVTLYTYSVTNIFHVCHPQVICHFYR